MSAYPQCREIARHAAGLLDLLAYDGRAPQRLAINLTPLRFAMLDLWLDEMTLIRASSRSSDFSPAVITDVDRFNALWAELSGSVDAVQQETDASIRLTVCRAVALFEFMLADEFMVLRHSPGAPFLDGNDRAWQPGLVALASELADGQSLTLTYGADTAPSAHERLDIAAAQDVLARSSPVPPALPPVPPDGRLAVMRQDDLALLTLVSGGGRRCLAWAEISG